MKHRKFIIAGLLLVAGIFLTAAVSLRPVPVVAASRLELLPQVIGDFRGSDDHFSASVYAALNADTHVYRHYRDAAGNQVSLYIGYYGTAKGGRTGHHPLACLVGAGWAVLDSRAIELRPTEQGASSRINYLLAQKDGSYETVLHWYQSDRDKIIVNGVQQNIQRFVGRVFHNRNDGAFVRVTATSDNENLQRAEERTRVFAALVLALLPDYWPLETDSFESQSF